jgi:hypothetical protein
MIQAWWHLSVLKVIQGTDQFTWTFYWSNMALAILLQAGIAGIVAAKRRRQGEIHGLFAGFVAGGVMTVGFLGINLLFRGGANVSFIWLTLSSIINGGAFLALPIVQMIPAIIGRMRPASPYGSTIPS